MTASPLPKDPPAPDPGDDGWSLLDALRRKLDDQATQQRKTAAQVTHLAESIAALVESQRRRSRWLNLNSFVAYLMFTVLCSIAFYFVYAGHARELAGERDRAVTERDAAVRRADDATAKLAQREAADAVVAKRAADVARAADDERAHEDGVLQAALAAIKAGHYAEVVVPVERTLVEHPSGPFVARLHYLAGVARAKTGDFSAAVDHLTAAVDADTVDEDARFQLASALDRSGQPTKARSEYDRFATAHPQSAFAGYAMRRSAQLAAPATPSTPAPAPVPPASAPAQ